MREPASVGTGSAALARWPLKLGVALLLVLLVAQIALRHRDEIAANAPTLGRLMQLLCKPFGCAVGPARQITDIVIESSSLLKRGGDGYRLRLTVRNQASIELATPDIELTLTDSQDRAVLRKVLAPADLGAPEALAANGEWTGSASLVIANGAERIAGFRVFAFYR